MIVRTRRVGAREIVRERPRKGETGDEGGRGTGRRGRASARGFHLCVASTCIPVITKPRAVLSYKSALPLPAASHLSEKIQLAIAFPENIVC